MVNKNVQQEIIKICEVNAIEKKPQKSFSMETEMNIENGLDSLAIMNIMIDLEDMYGINLDEHIEEISDVKTIGELIACMEVLIS